MTVVCKDPDQIANALIEKIGKRVVLGLPVGIGKSVPVADALFKRASRDPDLSLTIFTGLTLEAPRGRTNLERRFLDPFVDRLYSQWPTAAYAKALAKQQMPANVQVREFYLRPGAYLGNSLVQQNYTSINYSHVAGELTRLGINVIAQIVGSRADSPDHYSLGSNPDITLDLLSPPGQKPGPEILLVGQVNPYMPYMTGDAEVDRSRFDFILDDEAYHYPLFALPNRVVTPGDYATGMHVASLVPDGGTIQVGIGSLSDAVAHCLKLRHVAPDIFKDVLALLPGGSRDARRQSLGIEDQPFDKGLFSSTELLSDALFHLFETGVLHRPADHADQTVIQAGFFIGSSSLYRKLAELDEPARRRINMTSISNVNTLFGNEAYKRARRTRARFINETMMVTLLGAAVSDGLGDGRVVSGVGGQFDFVTMAHALEDAQSILMCRARRKHDGKASSNIRWNYPHATVPRHYRDVFVSEYGIAATRGMTDSETIDALLNIADSAFQEHLVGAAAKAGKLKDGYRLRAEALDNTPQRLEAVFLRPGLREHFPPYPLGTDFTATEQQLIMALEWLKMRTAGKLSTLKTLAGAMVDRRKETDTETLARMRLDQPRGLKERIAARLLRHALRRSKE